MKRQLIAALLALNVAAVAVPSATFTVSAAEVEAQANNNTQEDIELSEYRTKISDQIKAYKGKDDDYAFTYASGNKAAYDNVIAQADTKLNECSKTDDMDSIWDSARTEIDNLATDAEIQGAKDAIDNAMLDENGAEKYFSDTKESDPGDVLEKGTTGSKVYDKNVIEIANGLKANLEKETTDEAVKKYTSYFKEKVERAGLKTKNVLKEEYTANVISYLPEDYKMTDYSVDPQQKSIEAARNAAKATIATADTENAIREAYEVTYKNAINAVGEPVAVTKLKQAKTTELKNYLTGNTYTDVQQKAIDDYKADYTKKINAAAGKGKINTLYEEAIAKINAVITKDQSEAALNDAMNKIKAIGKLDASNYKEKYELIKVAKDAYKKLEEGSVGKEKLDTDNVFKTDENATVIQPHYTYKDLLDNAEDRYDDITIRALTETYKKLTNDLITINADNYQDYKVQYDNAQATEKTIFDINRVGDAKFTAAKATFNAAKTEADASYEKAKQTMLDLAVKEFATLLNGELQHVIDGGVAVSEENKADVEKAIKAYGVIASFAKTDHNLFKNVQTVTIDGVTIVDRGDADKYFRQKEGSYNTLVSLLDDYNKKLQIADDRINLEKATVVLAKDSVEYDGTQIDPGITVTNASGEVLVRDKDYIVRYDDNVNAGEVTVTVVGIGEYKKSQEKKFNITRKDISKETAKAADMYYYNGSARNGAVTVTVAGKNIANGTDYTVAYKNNKNIGKATAEITGKGNYTGTIKATYVIKPAKSPIKSLKAGKKKLTVKTAKQPGAKYQIAYKVKGGSYKTVKTSNVSKTIKSLKSGKTYAVKVRAYKSISGKTYYGRYSAVKTVKVK